MRSGVVDVTTTFFGTPRPVFLLTAFGFFSRVILTLVRFVPIANGCSIMLHPSRYSGRCVMA